jgi:acyl dehydratase
MTANQRAVEHRITAFLDGPDDRNIPNAIHSTEGAREYGYQAALVGGATVFGWATPAILDALGDSWLDRGWAEVTFRRPTYPGDELIVRLMPSGPEACELHIVGPDGHDRIAGAVGLGDASWLTELADPVRIEGEERPGELPRLTIDIAPVGEDLRPLATTIAAEDMVTYAREKQRNEHPLFTGERPRLHPGWVAARPIRVLHHSYDYGPAIHARSHIQFCAPAEAGQRLTTAAHLLEAYERKGHHYGVFDCVTRGERGDVLIRQRHTTIFEVAQRGGSGG